MKCTDDIELETLNHAQLIHSESSGVGIETVEQ